VNKFIVSVLSLFVFCASLEATMVIRSSDGSNIYIDDYSDGSGGVIRYPDGNTSIYSY
jgi:hypothetical protein